jgi:hypothetical protein
VIVAGLGQLDESEGDAKKAARHHRELVRL